MHELLDQALELYEERAAIMQYDGGLSRSLAEARALYEVALLVSGDTQESYKLVDRMKAELRKK